MTASRSTWRSLVAGLILLGPVPAVHAQNSDAQKVHAQDVVLEYGHIVHMLAERDAEPLLRIWSDGRVRVHYPDYSPQAGDYEARLTAEQLVALFEGLADDGLLALDIETERDQRRRHMASLRDSGVLYEVSDSTETVIRVLPARVPGFERSSSSTDSGSAGPGSAGPGSNRPPSADGPRSFRWENVYTDARDFPTLAGPQVLWRVEQRLRALVESVSGGPR